MRGALVRAPSARLLARAPAWARAGAIRATRAHSSTPSRASALLQELRRTLPPEALVEDPDIVSAHHRDWLGQYEAPAKPGHSPHFVVRPGSTAEVSATLECCSRHKIPVVPQGGNTGLVGGSVPSTGDEVVLSLSRMNAVLDFDPLAGVVTCEAGCVLDDLNSALAKHRFMMPLDLGSSGTCQIGGNLATNAGGLRVIRYGSLRSHVLGLEVVLASGEVVDLMSTLRKDNTGYDLKQMFIGSEGTLGVITKAALTCPPIPESVHVALLGLDSFEEVLQALAEMKRGLGEVLSAIEFWDAGAMELVLEQCSMAVPAHPLPGHESRFYMLVEVAGGSAEADQERLFHCLQPYSKGIVASEPAKVARLWAVRENIPVALKQRGGRTFKYDVSLPTKLLDRATALVADALRNSGGAAAEAVVYQYGHVGDGNLHLNVWSGAGEAEGKQIKEVIEGTLYPYLEAVGGSISAEHGIGVLKANAFARFKAPASQRLMRSLKMNLDPENLLNPGKLFQRTPNGHGAGP